jgi:hypothetical protein
MDIAETKDNNSIQKQNFHKETHAEKQPGD